MYQNASAPDLMWRNEDNCVLSVVQKKEWYCLAGKMVRLGAYGAQQKLFQQSRVQYDLFLRIPVWPPQLTQEPNGACIFI